MKTVKLKLDLSEKTARNLYYAMFGAAYEMGYLDNEIAAEYREICQALLPYAQDDPDFARKTKLILQAIERAINQQNGVLRGR